MTDDTCPVCTSDDTHPRTRIDTERYDRACYTCGFRWVMWARVRPGDHYVDVSGIVAQAVKAALAIHKTLEETK